ncbi:MAG: hypothetical protein KDD94_13705, partial [Calditrichaeota bacterium]|nr:hypothetical protein [Calditrichota bacterium]
IGNVILVVNWVFNPRLKKSLRFQKTLRQITITAPEQFAEMSGDVRSDLEEYAVLRMKRSTMSRELRKRVRSHFDLYFDSSPVKRKHYSDDSHHKLQGYFDKLNSEYFNNQCQVEAIGWSHHSSKRLLGKWCHATNSIIISSFLNSAKVPATVVQFIVYHEMCHQQFPPKQKLQRRVVHHRDFRKQEARYRDFVFVKDWFRGKGFII